MDVENSPVALRVRDNGGRRSGVDRRKFLYTDHIPERRAVRDRRNGFDRRSGLNRRDGNVQTREMNHRSGIERRAAFKV